MKVLMFGWEFPPHISGGLGTACFGLTKGLVKNDVEVIFVVPKAYGDEDKSFVNEVLGAADVSVKQKRYNYQDIWKDITYIEVGSLLIPYMSPEEFAFIFKDKIKDYTETLETDELGKFQFTGKYDQNLWQEVSNYAVVAAVIAANQDFDVIHAHDWLTYAAGIAAKKVTGKPLVVHVHATEYDRTGHSNVVNSNVFDIERTGMEYADAVITVSNFTRSVVVDKYGINPHKVFTVYNAVEPIEREELNFPKTVEEKVVTFMGRITLQKGPEYFIEAANLVLKKMKNVRFVMAGSGDMMNRMIRRAAKLGITSNFHFTGFLKGQEVDKMFSISDLYVMPSVSEPFGIAPLEAMRSNVPVIISRQSGVSEILRHALKINFWDIDAMADSIYGLLNYDGLSKMFRTYGKNEVDNLKWENAAQGVKQVYEWITN